MGWKENGKYGVSTGRTVRSPFASSYGAYFRDTPQQDKEVLLKFTRGTEGLSSRQMEEFLTQNDIGDGLGDFTESTTRLVRAQGVDRASKVPYSLKKRKRWRLSENVNLLGLEDSTETAPNVTFVYRRVQRKLKADCIAVEKTKENEVFLPRRRKYTRVQDLLKKSDKTDLEPEVCYEISYRYPMNEYPVCAEVHGRHLRWSSEWSISNPRKARCKNKGAKNKGHRWGLYSDAEVRSGQIAKEGLSLRKKPWYRFDGKIQVLEARHFKVYNACEERFNGSARFSLGSYIDGCSETPKGHSKKRQHRQVLGCKSDNQSLDCCFYKYGKNSVIYIDPEPVPRLSEDQRSAITTTIAAPKVLQLEKKVVVTLQLDADDVKPVNLKAHWKDLYSEANSFPRKFTIDITPLLPYEFNLNIRSCCILFEVIKNMNDAMVLTTTDVSLNVTRTKDNSSCVATTKFYSEIDNSNQEIWRVEDVVDCAVRCLQFFHPLQLPKKTTSLRKQKAFRSVEVLGSMFGWKTKVFTQEEMQSELWKKMKIAQEAQVKNNLEIYNGTDYLKNTELLEMSCGICCEELGNQRLASFTALKNCRHVFCNECWEVHLKTQISLGNTDLQCPGYKCDVSLDNATIMALVPSWYDELLSRKISKALEASPELRWCPSDSCNRIVKATTADPVVMTMDPVSVSCACGGLWCFQCGRRAHWPAPCAADEKFHEVTKQYFIEMELNKEELISSVMIRNCPTCRYPIEKHLGCNFMYCIMCQTSFCWECLTPMRDHAHNDGCLQHEQSKEIMLDMETPRTSHFARYFSVYCNSRKARSGMSLSRQRKRLRLVNRSLASYKSICSSHVYFDQTMEMMLQSSCHDILRSAAEFTYYAHLTLEGASKVAMVSKSTSRVLHQLVDRLQFIAEKIEGLTEANIEQLLRQNDLSKLSDFLLCGKHCVLKIGQIIARRQGNFKP